MASDQTTQSSDFPDSTVVPLASNAPRPTGAGLQSRAEGDEAEALTTAPATVAPPVVTTTRWLWGLLILCAIYAIFYLGAWTSSRSVKPPLVGPFSTSATPSHAPAVIVHVTGAVAHPGVYNLPFDARVTDAIHEAGGPLPNADTNALNLAAWVEDGTKIQVPTKAAPAAAAPPIVAPIQLPPQSAAQKSAAPIRPLPAPLTPVKVARPKPKPAHPTEAKADAGLPHAITPSGKTSKKIDPAYLTQHPINVNTAPATDLQELPGIGPAMAAKIIAYRQENGRFQAVDDLRNVKGIGEKKLEKLQALVTVK